LTGSASQSGQLASDLGVAARPDGSTQVTYNGHRLYTFAQDSPGKAGGEGLSDMFGGQHFTWHAVVVGGGTATNSTPPQTGGAAAYPGY
jgi:hypothetical protein